MADASNMQLRGHCQCCGRIQAVTNSHMAHHGYRVAGFGFFVGACSGHDFKPMEQDRAETDSVCAILRSQAKADRAQAEQLEAKVTDPEFILVTVRLQDRDKWGQRIRKEYQVPFCYGDEFEQADRRRVLVHSLRHVADQKDGFADMLNKLADDVHGKKLTKVVKAAAPDAIKIGERRKFANGSAVICSRVDGPRVYWKAENGRTGWTGTRAWRMLQLDGAEA